MIAGKTFADLEQAAGSNYSPAPGEKWPLQAWYDDVRLTPMELLSAGDFARACRQGVWVGEVVPLVIEMLCKDPAAGDLYDGELIVSLSSIKATYWAANRGLAEIVRQLATRHSDSFDDHIRENLQRLLAKL